MSLGIIPYAQRYVVDSGGQELALDLIEGSDAELMQLGEILSALDPAATYLTSAQSLAGYFSTTEPGAPRFKIRLAGEAAGILGLRLNWLRGPYLQYLAVIPRFQGRSIGTRVLAWFEREARARGERNIWICASAFNPGAAQLYQRQGFAIVAELDGLVADPHVELLMRKRLV